MKAGRLMKNIIKGLLPCSMFKMIRKLRIQHSIKAQTIGTAFSVKFDRQLNSIKYNEWKGSEMIKGRFDR